MNALLQVLLTRVVFDAAYRVRTWKKLSNLLSNGTPLEDSLITLQQRCVKRQSMAAGIFTGILDHLAVGHSLDIALMDYASPAEIMLISSGQSSNRLPEGLQLAADLLKARHRIFATLAKGLAMPCLLFFLCCVVLYVVGTDLIPSIAEIANPERWVGSAAALYAVSSFVASPWSAGVFVVAGAAVAAVILSMPRWTGRARLYADNLPPWSIYRLIVGCVWLYTLATLMRSGMQMARVLEYMLSSHTTSPYLRERVQAVTDHSRGGRNLGEAMEECGMNFPNSEIVDDMCIYAALPNFHVQLYEIAQQTMDNTVETIEHYSKQAHIGGYFCVIGITLWILSAVNSLQTQTLGGF